MFCPLDRIKSGIDPPAMNHNMKASVNPLGINRDHYALAAEFIRRLFDQIGVLHRRGVYRNLISPRAKHLFKILYRFDSAANRQRNKHLLGCLSDNIDDGAPSLMGSGNIQKDDLVCALTVIHCGTLYRIAHILNSDKVNTLDHPSVPNVQARDDSFCNHGIYSPSPTLIASDSSNVPL